MKMITRILSLVVLASIATLYVNCGGKDPAPESKEKTQLAKLAGTWVLNSVDNDGTDRTTEFSASVKMTISGTYANDGQSYQMVFEGTGPKNPLPKSGSFKFSPTMPESVLVKQDLVLMDYVVTGTTLSFKITAYGGDGYGWSRVAQVTGDWTFNFTKQ